MDASDLEKFVARDRLDMHCACREGLKLYGELDGQVAVTTQAICRATLEEVCASGMKTFSHSPVSFARLDGVA